MPRPNLQQEHALEWLRDLFNSDLTRLLLSVLIILSLLPFGWVDAFSMVFFGIFAVELFLRLSILRHDLRRRSLNKVELLFFALDVLATLSFLPMEVIWDDIRYLRLFRLSRMLLLLGYWGPIVREVWFILMKRERRYQIFFVLASALLLSFISAILLSHFRNQGIDFDGDGRPGNNSSFWAMLWWSFRQIQDPGNILQSPDASLAFFFSLFLTLCGMFLFSFLIGIGTSVVGELVSLGKQRRLGIRRHSVICNLRPYSRVLIEELVAYYEKSFRSPRIVTMGPQPQRYGYMLEGSLQRIRYRQGRALNSHDLNRVDTDRAVRVILLGHEDRDLSDSEVISQVLSVRQVNPRCDIYAELYRPENIRAALTAGGVNTVPILTDQLVGLFLANILVFPGIQEIYWELLTSRGDEIYTCLFDRGALRGSKAPSGPLMPFGELLQRCHQAHGVILLGHLLRDQDRPQGFSHALNPGSPRADSPTPPAMPAVDRLQGFFGVTDNFERLKGFVESLPDVSAHEPQPEPREVPRLATCPAATDLHRVLICGFHEGLVDFCEQLLLFARGLTIQIMVHEEAQIPAVLNAFVRRFRDEESSPGAAQPRVHLEVEGGHKLRLSSAREPAFHCEIVVILGDWSDEQALLEPSTPGCRLSEMDAILFTYAAGETDPDARTALGLIKLIGLYESNPSLLKPGFRIICEVQSTEKAELFERRFGRTGSRAGKDCRPVSFVPAERLRNALLAQSVFVPGIADIYKELLCETSQEICRLLISGCPDPNQAWTFSELLGAIYHRYGLLLIALELQDPQGGNPRVVLNPRRRDEDYQFIAGQLLSIFAIGDIKELSLADAPCSGCFAAGALPKDPDGGP